MSECSGVEKVNGSRGSHRLFGGEIGSRGKPGLLVDVNTCAFGTE